MIHNQLYNKHVSQTPCCIRGLENCLNRSEPKRKQKKIYVLADGDGENELVVAYTDRRVRCFRWQRNELPDLAHSLGQAPAARSQVQLQGKFVTLETWHLAGQVPQVIAMLDLTLWKIFFRRLHYFQIEIYFCYPQLPVWLFCRWDGRWSSILQFFMLSFGLP